jgi:hypothetical protein
LFLFCLLLYLLSYYKSLTESSSLCFSTTTILGLCIPTFQELWAVEFLRLKIFELLNVQFLNCSCIIIIIIIIIIVVVVIIIIIIIIIIIVCSLLVTQMYKRVIRLLMNCGHTLSLKRPLKQLCTTGCNSNYVLQYLSHRCLSTWLGCSVKIRYLKILCRICTKYITQILFKLFGLFK